MTSELFDALRHNTWATLEMIAFCRRLTPEQLATGAAGTYGSILSTLQHVVGGDSRYRWRLSGIRPDWDRTPEEARDLDELARMAEDQAAFWDRLVSAPFDADRTIAGRDRETDEPFEVEAGVLVAQALNHGNEHRAQIAAIITSLGIEPPELDGWHYGIASGRFRWVEEPGDG